jgi:NAD(P) transhydrogenase subunit alpha
MLIGVPLETAAGETRVAVTPETAKKLVAQGHQVKVQAGAGLAASVTDAAYEAAGATLTDRNGAFGAELVLKVQRPSADELALMKPGAALVGMLNPFDKDGLAAMAAAGLSSFALEAAPAPPGPRAWTCCPARPTSPATRRSSWRPTATASSSPC